MPKPAFHCDKCNTVYPSFAQAEKCESEHPDTSRLTIDSVSCDKVRVKGAFPNKVFITSSDDENSVAEYTLSHEMQKELFNYINET